jgi:hypothetical protein
MPPAEVPEFRAHYKGAPIEAGDVVWHPSLGRGVVVQLLARVDEWAMARTGTIRVQQDGAEPGNPLSIEIFSSDWMDLYLLQRQQNWKPLPDVAPRVGIDAGVPIYYAGEQILPGDLVYERWDVTRVDQHVAGIYGPGGVPAPYAERYPAGSREGRHGVIAVSRSDDPDGGEVSVELFPVGSPGWQGMVFVKHRPKARPVESARWH